MNMIALGCAKAVTGEIIQETICFEASDLFQYLEKLIHMDWIVITLYELKIAKRPWQIGMIKRNVSICDSSASVLTKIRSEC